MNGFTKYIEKSVNLLTAFAEPAEMVRARKALMHAMKDQRFEAREIVLAADAFARRYNVEFDAASMLNEKGEPYLNQWDRSVNLANWLAEGMNDVIGGADLGMRLLDSLTTIPSKGEPVRWNSGFQSRPSL